MLKTKKKGAEKKWGKKEVKKEDGEIKMDKSNKKKRNKYTLYVSIADCTTANKI